MGIVFFRRRSHVAVRLLADRRVGGNIGTVAYAFPTAPALPLLSSLMNIARLPAAVLLTLLVACSAPATVNSTDAPVVAVIIVKPRVATSDSAAVIKPMRAALGETAGIRYLRPMAGDAHIVYLTAPTQRSEVPQMIERLKASGAFQYVELDTMMKAQ